MTRNEVCERVKTLILRHLPHYKIREQKDIVHNDRLISPVLEVWLPKPNVPELIELETFYKEIEEIAEIESFYILTDDNPDPGSSLPGVEFLGTIGGQSFLLSLMNSRPSSSEDIPDNRPD